MEKIRSVKAGWIFRQTASILPVNNTTNEMPGMMK